MVLRMNMLTDIVFFVTRILIYNLEFCFALIEELIINRYQ